MASEGRYEQARAVIPGLLGAAWFRERVLMGITVAALIFSGWMWFRGNSQLATCKAEKGRGWVVVLDKNGGRLDLPVASADEYRLADGMVIERLERVVTCLYGLDPVRSVVSRCWDETSPLFVGDEAVHKFNAFAKATFPDRTAVAKQQREETRLVEIQGTQKPDKGAEGRYWLRWKVIHQPHNGSRQTEEYWSSTFDVQLVPLEEDPKTTGLKIVDWNQHQEKEAG